MIATVALGAVVGASPWQLEMGCAQVDDDHVRSVTLEAGPESRHRPPVDAVGRRSAAPKIEGDAERRAEASRVKLNELRIRLTEVKDAGNERR